MRVCDKGNKMAQRENEQRNQEILKKYKSGKTLKQISEEYGLSYGRIGQIIKDLQKEKNWKIMKYIL